MSVYFKVHLIVPGADIWTKIYVFKLRCFSLFAENNLFCPYFKSANKYV